jgi:hypothetical protein
MPRRRDRHSCTTQTGPWWQFLPDRFEGDHRDGGRIGFPGGYRKETAAGREPRLPAETATNGYTLLAAMPAW